MRVRTEPSQPYLDEHSYTTLVARYVHDQLRLLQGICRSGRLRRYLYSYYEPFVSYNKHKLWFLSL